jgi:hypothetical protein
MISLVGAGTLRSNRLSLVLVVLVALAILHLAGMITRANETGAKQKRAIREIRELGGIVRVDKKLPGQPVVEVDFERAGIFYSTDEGGGFDSAVGDADLKWLRGLTRLRVLNLNNSHITNKGLTQLKGLVNLRTLSLPNTAIGDAGMAQVKRLTHLEVLDLSSTRITNRGLKSLNGLTRLKVLSIRGTKVTDTGIERLRKALPKVTISR